MSLARFHCAKVLLKIEAALRQTSPAVKIAREVK
jgi:hypothetical protein